MRRGMDKEKDITVLLPTYWGNRMLFNCMESIMSYSGHVKILTYKNDVGWLQAANDMMMSLPNDDIILMNDDTLAVSDIVGALHEMAYSDDKIGMVGGKSLSMDQQTIINYGIYIAPNGDSAHRYFGQPRGSVKAERQQAIEGSCMYLKRAMLDEIGYFDPMYGMGYREEVDLAFRAREAGWKVVSTPKAEYIHLVSQTNAPLGIHNDTFDIFMDKWGKQLKQGKV
jgi:GT2 family glycosyltransferase